MAMKTRRVLAIVAFTVSLIIAVAGEIFIVAAAT